MRSLSEVPCAAILSPTCSGASRSDPIVITNQLRVAAGTSLWIRASSDAGIRIFGLNGRECVVSFLYPMRLSKASPPPQSASQRPGQFAHLTIYGTKPHYIRVHSPCCLEACDPLSAGFAERYNALPPELKTEIQRHIARAPCNCLLDHHALLARPASRLVYSIKQVRGARAQGSVLEQCLFFALAIGNDANRETQFALDAHKHYYETNDFLLHPGPGREGKMKLPPIASFAHLRRLHLQVTMAPNHWAQLREAARTLSTLPLEMLKQVDIGVLPIVPGFLPSTTQPVDMVALTRQFEHHFALCAGAIEGKDAKFGTLQLAFPGRIHFAGKIYLGRSTKMVPAEGSCYRHRVWLRDSLYAGTDPMHADAQQRLELQLTRLVQFAAP